VQVNKILVEKIINKYKSFPVRINKISYDQKSGKVKELMEFYDLNLQLLETMGFFKGKTTLYPLNGLDILPAKYGRILSVDKNIFHSTPWHIINSSTIKEIKGNYFKETMSIVEITKSMFEQNRISNLFLKGFSEYYESNQGDQEAMRLKYFALGKICAYLPRESHVVLWGKDIFELSQIFLNEHFKEIYKLPFEVKEIAINGIGRFETEYYVDFMISSIFQLLQRK